MTITAPDIIPSKSAGQKVTAVDSNTYLRGGATTLWANDEDLQDQIDDVVDDVAAITPIVGEIKPFAGITVPTGFLDCDGSALSRTTYADLYAAITASKGTFTVSIASPGVVTLNTHGLATGDCVELTTSGALPTGLSANTNYYVIYNDANSFWLATSYANAIAGTKINTSGTQSGTHTLRYCPWGISGASNFLLPDGRGLAMKGAGQQGTAAWASASYLGKLGHYNQDKLQGHYHYLDPTNTDYNAQNISASSGGSNALAMGSWYPANWNSTGIPKSDGTNGTPRTGAITDGPTMGVKYIIKY